MKQGSIAHTEILAVDPGFTGALAWLSYDPETDTVSVRAVADMPLTYTKGSAKPQIDRDALVSLCQNPIYNPTLAIIEEVGAAPGQGVSSMFRFGYGAGLVAGVCAASGMGVRLVRPQHWQKWARKRPGKGAAREHAVDLFKDVADKLKRSKDHGRADAILIGYAHISEQLQRAPSMKPHGYQQIGIDFLAPRASAILADDAGLGKSMQMIGAANKAGHARILVECPAIGRVSWGLQFETWDTTGRPVYFYPFESGRKIPNGPCVIVVTYDWLSRGRNREKFIRALNAAQPFDLAICDEAHYLKTPTTARTKATYGARLDRKNSVTEHVAALWIASATLTPKHAGELYTHMKAILPEVLVALFGGQMPTKRQFEDRYCIVRHDGFGLKVEGNNPNTIPQLRDAIRPHLLMRRKVDVLKDLPPIQCVPLPFEVADKDLKAAAIDAFFADVPGGASDDEFLTLLGQAFADPAYAAKRRALGLVKVAPAVEWIVDFLTQTNRKLVIFAHHRDVIEQV
ncbi:hypothetical protein ADUPG1_011682, partial [Aduncisulcus paluster]